MKRAKFFLSLMVILGLVAMVWPEKSEAAAARIAWAQNTVQVRAGSSWVSARGGMSLNAGSYIRTGNNSRAQIAYADGSVVRLGSRTTVRIQSVGANKSLKINKGKALFRVQKQSRNMKVRTPTAVATVMGTEFLVEVSSTANQTETLTKTDVTVLEGTVNVASQVGDAINLTGGMATSVVLNQAPAPPAEINVDQFKQQEDLTHDEKTADAGNTGNSKTTTATTTATQERRAKVVNAPVAPDNTTQQVQVKQSTPERPENLNTSPTTGDLEIIIK